MENRFQFNFYINTMCNQKCSYCYARAGMKWNTISPYEEIIKNINLLINRPKCIISLIGGEPTLHPKFENILRSIKDLNHNLHIYTNGTSSFFNNLNYDLYRKFLWTFSYHGKFTNNEEFKRNILKFINNNINIELTVPAQNFNKDILRFIQYNKIKTVITFIHDNSKTQSKENIKKWVLELEDDNIKNMSKYFYEDAYYKGYTCYYNEIDVINSKMRTNDCNHNLNLFIDDKNLDYIFSLPLTVCKREKCKRDCAFLLPRKQNDIF